MRIDKIEVIGIQPSPGDKYKSIQLPLISKGLYFDMNGSIVVKNHNRYLNLRYPLFSKQDDFNPVSRLQEIASKYFSKSLQNCVAITEIKDTYHDSIGGELLFADLPGMKKCIERKLEMMQKRIDSRII